MRSAMIYRLSLWMLAQHLNSWMSPSVAACPTLDRLFTSSQPACSQVAAARAAAEAEAEAEDEATAAAEGADPAGGDGAAVEGPGEDAAEEAAGLEVSKSHVRGDVRSFFAVESQGI